MPEPWHPVSLVAARIAAFMSANSSISLCSSCARHAATMSAMPVHAVAEPTWCGRCGRGGATVACSLAGVVSPWQARPESPAVAVRHAALPAPRPVPSPILAVPARALVTLGRRSGGGRSS